jgi:gas vesicle protein
MLRFDGSIRRSFATGDRPSEFGKGGEIMARRDELMEEIERLRQQLADRDEQEGGIMGFLGGLALGTLLGGALALVFAPQTGEETREQLRDTSIQLRERATQLADQVKEQAPALPDQVRERAQTLTDTAREQVQNLTSRAQDAAEDARQQAQMAADTARDKVQEAGQAASARAQQRTGQGGGAQSGGARGGQGQTSTQPPAGSYSSAAMRPSSAETTPQPELERHYGGPEEQSKPGGQQ